MEPKATEPIPPEQWGPDHWSVLAYAFSTLGKGGILDRQKLRLDGGTAYPTKLAEGATRTGHDDLDCIEDMAAAGLLVNNGTGMTPAVLFTIRGLRVGQWLCFALTAGTVRRSTVTWEMACREVKLFCTVEDPCPTRSAWVKPGSASLEHMLGSPTFRLHTGDVVTLSWRLVSESDEHLAVNEPMEDDIGLLVSHCPWCGRPLGGGS